MKMGPWQQAIGTGMPIRAIGDDYALYVERSPRGLMLTLRGYYGQPLCGEDLPAGTTLTAAKRAATKMAREWLAKRGTP